MKSLLIRVLPYCVALLLATSVFGPTQADTPRKAEASGGEFVLLGEGRLERLLLQVEIDGTPAAALWEEGMAALLDHFDADNSGDLNQKEAARLPSPFGLRQVTAGLLRFADPEPPWKHLDSDRDGKVTRTELASYYSRHGVGSPLVAVGQPPFTRRLSRALIEHLDTDGNRILTEAELRKAESLLARLDRNADERIAVGELSPQATYPGAVGATLLGPPRVFQPQPSLIKELPLIHLPAGEGELWSYAAADRPGITRTAEELRKWREQRPDHVWTVRLSRESGRATALSRLVDGKPVPAEDGWLTANWSNVVWRLRADPGQLDESTAVQRKQIEAHFAAADADGDGRLSPKELTNPSFIAPRLILPWADRDADGTLTRTELQDWLTLTQKLARSAVMVTVLDHGQGLFEGLDADHDGWLSTRELRAAWENLKRAGCVNKDVVDLKRLPRTLMACISRGHPREPLPSRPARGPEWFRAMDRNGDGDISAREWIGDIARFRKLDTDGDGLLDPEEGARGN